MARYKGLIKTAVSSQYSLTRTNFHGNAWFSARMDVAMWAAGLYSWSQACTLQRLAMVRWLWSLAEQCFYIALLCCCSPLAKRSVWGNRPLRPSTRSENRTFRSPPSFLLLSCLFCLGARQSASVSCLRLAPEYEHVIACQHVTFWSGFASAARLNSWDEAFLTQPLQANMWSGRFHRWHILVSSFKHVKCVAQYVVSGMIYNVLLLCVNQKGKIAQNRVE